MMVGRELKNLFPKLEVKQGSELLRVEGLSKKGKFRDVSFCLHEGEILGFYGLVGAGRTEVVKAIFGMEPANSGKIFIRGKEVKITHPNTAIELGMGYVSENRDDEGIILNMSITSLIKKIEEDKIFINDKPLINTLDTNLIIRKSTRKINLKFN